MKWLSFQQNHSSDAENSPEPKGTLAEELEPSASPEPKTKDPVPDWESSLGPGLDLDELEPIRASTPVQEPVMEEPLSRQEDAPTEHILGERFTEAETEDEALFEEAPLALESSRFPEPITLVDGNEYLPLPCESSEGERRELRVIKTQSQRTHSTLNQLVQGYFSQSDGDAESF